MSFALFAQDLLDQAAVALDNNGNGAPVRRFVSHSPPVWELCETDQLTVHVSSVTVRQSRGRIGCLSQLVATCHVQLVRCHPALTDSGPPMVTLLDTVAKDLLTDLYALMSTLDDGFGDCDMVEWGSAVPLGPSGAIAGWDWTITSVVQ